MGTTSDVEELSKKFAKEMHVRTKHGTFHKSSFTPSTGFTSTNKSMSRKWNGVFTSPVIPSPSFRGRNSGSEKSLCSCNLL